jgi:predicted ATP-grasp superfamily ATP-dependent carboligase
MQQELRVAKRGAGRSNDVYRTPAVVCDADKLSQIAIIQELGRLGIPVVALAGSPRAIGFGSKYLARRIVCPIPSHDSEYVPFLVANAPRGAIFYSNDANAENIARGAEQLRANGFSLLISTAETLERVVEKDRLYQTGLECGVAVPKCRLVSSAAELEASVDEFGLPLILKSTNLAGGVYRFLSSPEDAGSVFREMNDIVHGQSVRHRNARLMAQQWIRQSNTALWNFNACAERGEILSFSMGRRIRTDVRPDGTLGSVLLYGRSELNPAILERNARLLKHIEFSGIVETEWSESGGDPGSIYLYDFNPRPSGNIRWAFKSGVSLAEQYYRAALGLSRRRQAMKTGTVYAKVLYRTSDMVESFSNPRLSFFRKLMVLREDLAAVVRFRRHAVDVLDPRDLGPTFRAVAELGPILARSFRSAALRLMSGWARPSVQSTTNRADHVAIP